MVEKINQIPFGITIFLLLLIFYVSGITFSPSNEANPPGIYTILYHMSIFFFLAIFLFLSLPEKEKSKLVFVISPLIAVVYAASDEFHQSFVPGRVTSAGDFLVDCIGIAFASLVYIIIRKLRERAR